MFATDTALIVSAMDEADTEAETLVYGDASAYLHATFAFNRAVEDDKRNGYVAPGTPDAGGY